MPEFWRILLPYSPTTIMGRAEEVEAEGWDGLSLSDTQCLTPEVWVMLTAAAAATSRIGLSTGVVNPVTRHPSVVASAAMALDALSGERMMLGVGRGDSAHAHIGLRPTNVDGFERFIERVQTYLRGEPVPMNESDARPDTPPLGDLRLGTAPASSRMLWNRSPSRKVPVNVFASGPRSIGVAARAGDRITLGLGAVPERVAWAIEVARRARTAAELNPDDLRIGCVVIVIPHADLAEATAMGAAHLGAMARLSVIDASPAGPVTEEDRRVFDNVKAAYDMRRHSEADTPQTSQLTPEFAERLGVIGNAQSCIARLRSLCDLGISFFYVVTAGDTMEPATMSDATRTARDRLLNEVVPAVRGA